MDKQKVPQIYFEPAREQTGCTSNSEISCKHLKHNFEDKSNDSVLSLLDLINDQIGLKDLKNTIVSKIPTIFQHV